MNPNLLKKVSQYIKSTNSNNAKEIPILMKNSPHIDDFYFLNQSF